MIQPPQHIPLHYVERLQSEITKMSKDDIIEGPLEIEEPGTYISNLVITDKKWDPEKIRVTLDCQQVKKDVYQTHEPIPTSEELRHKLRGCDRFSMLDIRNCYQGNCLHFALPGEYFATKEWLWGQARPAVRYRRTSEK